LGSLTIKLYLCIFETFYVKKVLNFYS